MKSSTSASASNKRKISHDDDNELDDENMDKFYALINNIREARDRFITNNSSSAAAEIVKKDADAVDDRSETKKRKLEEDQEKQAVEWNWSPSFRSEDFMDKADNKAKDQPPMSFAGTSQSKALSDNNDEKDEVKEELDLTLSL